MKIHDLPVVDRPREKLAKYGAPRLSNAELLAILLGTGTKGVNVVELSSRILKKFSGSALAEANFAELRETAGLGPARACEIIACFELGRRLMKGKKAALHLTPADVCEQLKDIRDLKKEHFVVFFLDSRSQEIRRETISIGTLNASLVHPREVFEQAIKLSAAQIIVAHNHPSGDPEPSAEDREITKRLAEAGKILGIELVDHILVAGKSFRSMREQNLM